VGLGYGTERATILSEEPLRGDGLKEAITNAMKDASITWEQIDFRITDANGEQYWFKEASLALTRTLRMHKAEVDLWHPADSIGEIGAAIVPCVLGVSRPRAPMSLLGRRGGARCARHAGLDAGQSNP
jgi:3-oxoacyl-[acyl-carrier-protein] synthase-1